MLNQSSIPPNGFAQHLRSLQGDSPVNESGNRPGILQSAELGQWLQYWNDADSVSGNLRKLEHWLQRARLQR
ncbi:MAG: hypothetical protein QM808_00060 [Steroidobacteraceae bacterium]